MFQNSHFLSPFYEEKENNRVKCLLCNHYCIISEGKRGLCNVRENINGKLYSLNKNLFIAINIDPIEKKPLYHFYPASKSLSIATMGCNFKCPFCQNYDISQIREKDIRGTYIPSEKIVELALKNQCISISYTYSEPTIFFETAYEIGAIAREKGIKNVFVTNGYLSKETQKKAKEFLDAANIDLKSFKDSTYQRVCGASLNGVLNTIEAFYKEGIVIEITTLIVPGMNDSLEELKDIARFILSLSPEIPWHISRFFPHFKMANVQPTPLNVIDSAYKIGKDVGLKYVYKGNVWGEGENTFCPDCGILLIERMGFEIIRNVLNNNKCPNCSKEIYGVF